MCCNIFNIRLKEGHDEVPSFVELIRFLTLYLDFETTKTIEKWGNKHILKPDEDTRAFFVFVKSEINKTLRKEREDVTIVIEELITDYQLQMQNYARHSSSDDSHDAIRIDAGMKLIEGLEGMIPEPKRSNFKHKTLHVTKDCLEDYVNDVREELDGYIYDREYEIQQRLTVLLANFKNDLFALSRQLRVVSKIDLLMEELQNENISVEEKANIYNIAVPIKNSLKKEMFTSAMEENISELIITLFMLAERVKSRKIRKRAKELKMTVNYLFEEYSKHH
ncbi:unnamed protein product [Nezara viridula]|uniref:Uncharacterized protein n=1 Tax=Nezara viridula TaxID=85310 RepID=A0A9P0HLZ1_NEZVI|nr:unnamed protein product [Nezara viridula]